MGKGSEGGEAMALQPWEVDAWRKRGRMEATEAVPGEEGEWERVRERVRKRDSSPTPSVTSSRGSPSLGRRFISSLFSGFKSRSGTAKVSDLKKLPELGTSSAEEKLGRKKFWKAFFSRGGGRSAAQHGGGAGRKGAVDTWEAETAGRGRAGWRSALYGERRERVQERGVVGLEIASTSGFNGTDGFVEKQGSRAVYNQQAGMGYDGGNLNHVDQSEFGTSRTFDHSREGLMKRKLTEKQLTQRPVFEYKEYVRKPRDPTVRRSHRKSLSDGYISVEEDGEGREAPPPSLTHFGGALTQEDIEEIIFSVYRKKAARAAREYSIPAPPALEAFSPPEISPRLTNPKRHRKAESFADVTEISPRPLVKHRRPDFSFATEVVEVARKAEVAVLQSSSFSQKGGKKRGGVSAQGIASREVFADFEANGEYAERSVKGMRRRRPHRQSLSDGYVSPEAEDDDFDGYGVSPPRMQLQRRERRGGGREGGRERGGGRAFQPPVDVTAGGVSRRGAVRLARLGENEVPKSLQAMRPLVESGGLHLRSPSPSKHSGGFRSSSSVGSPRSVGREARQVQPQLRHRKAKGSIWSPRERGDSSLSSEGGEVETEDDVEDEEEEERHVVEISATPVKRSLKRSESDRLLRRHWDGHEAEFSCRRVSPGGNSTGSRVGGFSDSSLEGDSSVSQSSGRRKGRRKERRRGHGEVVLKATSLKERRPRRVGAEEGEVRQWGEERGERDDGWEEDEESSREEGEAEKVPKSRDEKRKLLLNELKKWKWKDEGEGEGARTIDDVDV